MRADEFAEKGWLVVDFADVNPVFAAKAAMEERLASLMGKKVPLEAYHHEITGDEQHDEIQYEMSCFFRDQRYMFQFFPLLKEPLLDILGFDISMQTNPYLRIARPGVYRDNIGYHRDTHYGTSPYELSIHVPYVDLPPESALGVISGTHTHAEKDYPTKKIDHPNQEIYKGSKKHQVGFLYSPKMMEPEIASKIEPVPLKVGQALIFSLSIIHGSVVNNGEITRWSTDGRVRSTFAPVEMGERSTSYETVHASAVTTCAQHYFEANKHDPRDKDEMELCIQHLYE